MDKAKLANLVPILAQKHGFKPELIEKDYYLTMLLNNIESNLSKNIAFKGGTLLNKIHLNYHRLSEDLDFAYYGKENLGSRSQRSKVITPIRENMPYFLTNLELKSENPKGEGFNNSTQYVFNVSYDSFVTGKIGNVKLEISLRRPILDEPVYNVIKHFYKDPFTGEDMIPANKVLSLSFNEAVAEKLKAAITRKDVAIRDYYDLWYIAESKFNFYDKRFIELFRRKLSDEGYKGDYEYNFGLSDDKIALLHRQVETDLLPVIRVGEKFDLDAALDRFNKILNDIYQC